jgi:hypothetical protein
VDLAAWLSEGTETARQMKAAVQRLCSSDDCTKKCPGCRQAAKELAGLLAERVSGRNAEWLGRKKIYADLLRLRAALKSLKDVENASANRGSDPSAGASRDPYVPPPPTYMDPPCKEGWTAYICEQYGWPYFVNTRGLVVWAILKFT